MKIHIGLLLGTALAITGCGSQDTEVENLVSAVGLPSGKSVTRSLFSTENSNGAEQYIRNYLFNEYTSLHSIEHPVAMPAEPTADAAASDTAISSTNTIETNVDEADFIKAFKYQSKDYLVTVTEPQYTVTDLAFAVKSEPTFSGSGPAKLNLYAITQAPEAELITRLTLNENAHYVSGFYQFSDQLIVQSSVNNAAQWDRLDSWNNGKSSIESVKLTSNTLTNNWDIVFDGHIVESRRIDSQLYVVMRHTSFPSGLQTPYREEDTDNNIQIINNLDISSFIPNITQKTKSAPAFALSECYLPDDNDRYLAGGIAFNYLAQIDLNSGEVSATHCILADINQVYMNEQSLFLIDSNEWAGQTSRLHRFDLASLRYDTSLKLAGSLGWRSAEFRIKELNDGTVVTVTSENNPSDNFWCCNNNATHKLQLFNKSTSALGSDYQQVAELPNETYPDLDNTPLSLGKAGEEIYGVRIDEQTVKVVTFLQTDPLYIFDITDRKNPSAIGELEQDGFSAYLHNFADLTLGIGFDANEWGQRKGLKVELYESAEHVQSLEQIIIGEHANTPVEYDHHAFASLAIGDTGSYRIAFPATIYGQDYDYQQDTGLLLFTLDTQAKTLTHDGTLQAENSGSNWQDRAVIQGDAVHYVHQGKIYSSLWADPVNPVVSD